jgi:hypothetical protein
MKLRSYFSVFLAAGFVCSAAEHSLAQTGLLVSGGTHVRDGSEAYGYAILQLEPQARTVAAPGVSSALTLPQFSVYKKDGPPSAPGDFTLVSVLRPAVDEATVQALLERSWRLRPTQTPAAQEAELGAKLDELFGTLTASASSQSAAAKLSNVVAAAMVDPQYREELSLLGKTFPGVNMALGHAWAGSISAAGPTTLEFRLRSTEGEDLAVVSRLTLDGSQLNPVPLPAPGRPFAVGLEIPDTELPPGAFEDFRNDAPGNDALTATGFAELKTQLAGRLVNRAARLRWSTPVGLRQRSILQNGFNIWRLPGDALNPDWLAEAPSLGALVAAGAVKVNQLPVMIPEELSPAQAEDAGNTALSFFTDEVASSIVLPEGAAPFVYFVSAVDVLGRDGVLSPGRIVTICDRMPPSVVGGVQVLNDYQWTGGTGGAGAQRFVISWAPVPEDQNNGTIEYEVFRWNRYDGPQRSLGAQPIATVTGQAFLDEGLPGSPNEENAHETFWYTIRAVRVSDCGRFPASHSGPVFGVIRDRGGPGIAGGTVDLWCLAPAITATAVSVTTTSNSQDDRIIPVTLRTFRGADGLEWVEYASMLGGQPVVLSRQYFDADGVAEYVIYLRESSFLQDRAELGNLRARVGASNGAVSSFIPPDVSTMGSWLKNTSSITLPFDTSVTLIAATNNSPCPEGTSLSPVDPEDRTVRPTTGRAQTEPGAGEVQIFRQIDDGPLTYVARVGANRVGDSIPALWDEGVEWIDGNPPPVNGGTVCYYLQAFSEDGLSGPMVLIRCLSSPALALPVPSLAAITSDGAGPGGPRFLQVRWTCSPVGVDRFKVFISENGFVPPSDLGVNVLGAESTQGQGVSLPGQDGKLFGTYLSSRINGGFSGDDEEEPVEFSFLLPAQNGSTYTVAVKAVGSPPFEDQGAGAPEGDLSNIREGLWMLANQASPDVPWPARPIPPRIQPSHLYLGPSLPLLTKEFPADLALTSAVLSGNTFDGAAVRIGQVDTPNTPLEGEKRGAWLVTSYRFNPDRGIFRVSRNDHPQHSLFPCVLYRYRVSDTNDPALTSDLVQVTPLMESIAYGFSNPQRVPDPLGNSTIIYDPYIQVVDEGPITGGRRVGLYLTDTLPVVSGQTYRYLLVRFDPVTKEPRDVIPVPNPVTVP